MEKSKFLTIVIVCLLVLNLGTLTFLFIVRGPGGPGGHHGPPHGKEGPARFIVEELGFNEQQKADFEKLKKEHQGQMRMMEDSMRIQREMLPDLIVDGNRVAADSVAAKIAGYQKQIELYTFEHFTKVNALCNDEQKKKFKEIIGDILKMMGPPPKGGPPGR